MLVLQMSLDLLQQSGLKMNLMRCAKTIQLSARRGNYGSIRITVNGEEYGTYSLGKDQVIKINGTNVCEIKNGEVKMTEADCPDHLCMKQKAVDSTGGTIVCLPNKVVIEGEKGESLNEDSPEFDTAV